MQNENQKLNPLTCELQVGDVVEVIKNIVSDTMEIGSICTIVKNDNSDIPFLVERNDGEAEWVTRDELRLISRNGKPIEEQWQPKSGETVWCKFLECAVIVSDAKAAQHRAILVHWQDDIDADCNIFPVPVSELEPYTGQDKPVIDFGKAGLILTDGEIVVVTTGAEADGYFEASCLLQSKDFGDFPYRKNKAWRDITAEAEPILQQLKTLMK